MQFVVRLNSYRIVMILLSVGGIQIAQGQDPLPPATEQSADNPAVRSVPVEVTQPENPVAHSILPGGAVMEENPPVFEGNGSQADRGDVSTAGFDAPSIPLQAMPVRQQVQPGDPVLQASTIDQAETAPGSGGVNPIAVSVVEGRVQPATFNQPRTEQPSPPSPGELDLDLPRKMMEQFELSRAATSLPGRPVTLLELLRQTRVAYRSDMINQYWSTHADWAMLQNSKEYQQWLQQLSRPQTAVERILLSAARNEAESQVMSAEIQLGISQQRLQELVGMPGDLLPLPQDVPLIKGYQTHYEWFSSRNLVPPNLRGINHRLPMQLKLISQQAETARIAKSAMNQTRTAFVSGQLGVAAVLEAGRLWRSGSQQMIETVAQYNQTIADYAIAIHPDFKSPDQIVAMLISRPGSVAPENTSRSVLDPSRPVARSADRSFDQPWTRSSTTQNPQPPGSPESSNTLSSTGTPVTEQPLRTTRGGFLAPYPPPTSPSGAAVPPGSATSPTATPSSASVLEPGLPGGRPNLIPLSTTSPPGSATDNGFRPLPATPPAKVQPPISPSKNGFDGSPIHPPGSVPPPTNNNSFGGGSFGGS